MPLRPIDGCFIVVFVIVFTSCSAGRSLTRRETEESRSNSSSRRSKLFQARFSRWWASVIYSPKAASSKAI